MTTEPHNDGELEFRVIIKKNQEPSWAKVARTGPAEVRQCVQVFAKRLSQAVGHGYEIVGYGPTLEGPIHSPPYDTW